MMCLFGMRISPGAKQMLRMDSLIDEVGTVLPAQSTVLLGQSWPPQTINVDLMTDIQGSTKCVIFNPIRLYTNGLNRRAVG